MVKIGLPYRNLDLYNLVLLCFFFFPCGIYKPVEKRPESEVEGTCGLGGKRESEPETG